MTSKNVGGEIFPNIHIVTAVSLNKSVMLEGSTDFTQTGENHAYPYNGNSDILW